MNQYVAPYQQSGSANVPITESTGAQIQGTMNSDGIIENASYSGTPQASPNVFTDNVVLSGNITVQNQTIVASNFLSGVATAGLVIAGNSNASGYIANLNSGSPSLVGPAVVTSGNATNTAVTTNSGAFAPNGYFFINVPTSGSPWVKVPFFNS